MIKLINAITGTVMWVADERVEEYKAAGHIPAADVSTATEPNKEPEIAPVQSEKKRRSSKNR